MPIFLRVLDLSLAFLAVVILRQLWTRHRQGPLPPGPRGLPLIGNALDMPSSYEWLTFSKWADRWGNIISLNLVGQPMIILNGFEQAVAMLDRKGSIYSDRPRLVMACDLVGWDTVLPLMPYGDQFRETRRFFNQFMGSKASLERFHTLIETETQKFLRRLLSIPDHVHDHIRKTAGAIILMITYGYNVQEGSDPYVELADKAIGEFSIGTTPGAFAVDTFPILRYLPRWFPGAGFLKLAERWRQDYEQMIEQPFNFVKAQMMEGVHVPSFTSELLGEENLTSEKELYIKFAASAMYGGGSDTTVSAIYSFFLAMMLNPKAQAKAQEEIDRVVGDDRLPCLADRDDLPYVEALVKEVLRLNPVAPLGLPHRTTSDDIHAGYYIPKDSIIVANIWKMTHDPLEFSDPFIFNPDRFLGENTERDPKQIVFGFGLNLADSSVWLACATTLATFDISKKEENGVIIEPVSEYTSETISHPRDFPCSIKPRSSKAQDLVSLGL